MSDVCASLGGNERKNGGSVSRRRSSAIYHTAQQKRVYVFEKRCLGFFFLLGIKSMARRAHTTMK